MRDKLLLEKAFVILFALAVCVQIFVPPVVGLADNGDFARIIDKVGIIPNAEKQYMGNINLTFDAQPKFTIKGYQSSELIFVYASLLINAAVNSGQFHLLILAGLHVLAFLAAIWLVLRGIHGVMPRARWVVYLALLLFFTDVGYIAYLNSLYSEPASIIFFALLVGVVLIIAGKARLGEVGAVWLVAYFAACVLFVVAKPQNAAMGVLLAFLGYRMFVLLRVRQPALNNHRKLAGGVLALGLVALSFLYFAFGLPRYYRSGDLWNSVFKEILVRTDNPEQALDELGLPREMVAFKGTYAFSDGVNRNAYPEFQHSWLYFRILKYYGVHPDQLFEIIDDTTHTAFELQPENLGNFTISRGSYEKSETFGWWNDIRFMLLPKSIWTLVVLLALNLGAIFYKLTRVDRAPSDRLISETHLVIVMMALFQYLTVVLAEGTFELIKHMFLFNLLLDVSFIFLIAYLASLVSHSRAQPVPLAS